MNTIRHAGLDILKLLCAFCVVCMHTHYPYKYLLEPAIRFAVPVFFLISGYFYPSVCRRGHQKTQLKKAGQLFLLANVVYLIYELVFRLLCSGNVSEYLNVLFRADTWLKLLLFNQPPFSQPLWYLGAFFYILLLAPFAEKAALRLKSQLLIPLLLIIGLVLGTYSRLLTGQTFPVYLSRNFLFFGLPCFLLGKQFADHPPRVSNRTLILGLFLSWAFVLGENYFLYKKELLILNDFYLATPVNSALLFLLVLNNPDWFQGRICHALASIGKTCSMWIYLLHPMVIPVVKHFLFGDSAVQQQLQRIYTWSAPVVIFAISLFLAWILTAALRICRRK